MDRVLTPQDLAERYGLEVTDVQDWRDRCTGPSYFCANDQIFYREAAVLDWEREQECQQTIVRHSERAT